MYYYGIYTMNLKYYIDPQTAKAIKRFPHRTEDIVQSFDPKQIECKQWLVNELRKSLNHFEEPSRIYIAGSWYGNVLVPLLQDLFPEVEIQLHDIDEEVIKISKNIYFLNNKNVNAWVNDSTDYLYSKKNCIVINTSCEHMTPLHIKPGTFVALQSNNYREIEEHINCVDSADELANQYDIKEIYYSGEKQFEKYTRYMVIGKV